MCRIRWEEGAWDGRVATLPAVYSGDGAPGASGLGGADPGASDLRGRVVMWSVGGGRGAVGVGGHREQSADRLTGWRTGKSGRPHVIPPPVGGRSRAVGLLICADKDMRGKGMVW